MTFKEFKKLSVGLYQIVWDDDTCSWGSLGVMANGERWLAPCNWILPAVGVNKRKWWKSIKAMHKIEQPFKKPGIKVNVYVVSVRHRI